MTIEECSVKNDIGRAFLPLAVRRRSYAEMPTNKRNICESHKSHV